MPIRRARVSRRTIVEWIDDAEIADRSVSTAEVLEQLVLINETGGTIGLIGRLYTNTKFGIVEIHAVQFEKTDEHVTEIGVFDRTRTAACRAATAATTDAIIEMVIVDITVIVAAAVIVVG